MVILRHGHDGCCSLLLIMTEENVDLFLRSAGNIRTPQYALKFSLLKVHYGVHYLLVGFTCLCKQLIGYV